MKNAISLNLDADRCDHAKNRESLGELLSQAAEISFPGAAQSGEHYVHHEMRWICKWAVRAVCEEIIRTGGISVPLEVTFSRLWQRPASGFGFQPGRN